MMMGVQGFSDLPPWHDVRWLILVAAVAVLLAGWAADEWAEKRRVRLAAARKAARKAARRPAVMPTTGEHKIVEAVRASTRRAPSILDADQRQLLAMVRSLQTRLTAAQRELQIRPEPDPILRVLLDGPRSVSQVAATLGVPVRDVDRRLLRLAHVTEQVEKVRAVHGDWLYQLAGIDRSARSGTLPARGKAG